MPRAKSGGTSNVSAVVARLDSLRSLTPEETRFVCSLDGFRKLEAGAMLHDEGSLLRTAVYLVSGWACRQRVLADGSRQIVSLVLPGEGVGLCRRPRPVAFTSAIALTPLTLVDASPMIDGSPIAEGMDDILSEAAALDEHRLISHVVRLGRRSAQERVCDLLLELYDRLAAIGETDGPFMPLPVTQEILADTLGLSIVHMNRTLQQLRREGLLTIGSGEARLLDRARMERVAGFAPDDRR